MKDLLINRAKQTNIRGWIATTAIMGIVLSPLAGRADDQTELVQKLLDRIEQLEKKVDALESVRTNTTNSPPVDAAAFQALEQKLLRNELAMEAAAEKAKAAPVVTIGENGLQARSADTNFAIALHGVLQVDNRSFIGGEDIEGNSTFLLRRARPILQGTLYHDFDFLFVPEFGGGANGNSSVSIQDAYLNYRYEPWLQFRAGKYKVPIGLEHLQSDPATLFNERSLVTDLVPNRDIGFQLWGDIAGGVVSYAAGIFNGVGDGRSTSNTDFDDNREFAGRIFAQPFKNSRVELLHKFGFGVAGSWGDMNSSASGLPNNNGFATDGQQQFFVYTNGVADGDHWRLSPQTYYYHGPFGLLAEYVISNQRVSRTIAPLTSANLEHTAWQVAASWMLTGEDASFTGVTPKHPFDPRNGKWGAFQLVGRYAELDVDNDAFPTFADPGASASAAQAWSVGLNWYLNKDIRVNASYSRTTFTGGGVSTASSSPAAVTQQPEEVFFTRLQLAF